MRIIVTGRAGQVARALAERGALAGHDIVALGRPDFDLTAGDARIGDVLAAAAPDVIVSAAAYTAVDMAESEREQAYAVNADGAGRVARAARLIGVPLVHLSTDYVFDGTKATPYVEDDPTGPKSVYGASKLAGETQVLAEQSDAAVLRTAWVYSPFGSNFVRTMLRLAESRDEIGVVDDQHGNPTSALDIADAVIAVAANLTARRNPALRGIFHMSGAGETSWAGFASAIFAASAALGGPAARVRPIATADYPTRAPRPASSRLDCGRLARVHGVHLPDWHDSVQTIVRRLVRPQP